MRLSKALKLKNRLAGEITKLKLTIQTHNSVRKGKTPDNEFEVRALFVKLEQRIDELVLVKTAIAVANAGVVPGPNQAVYDASNFKRIFLLAELKGEIEFLRTIDTKHGVFNEGYAAGGMAQYEVTYEAAFRERDISAMVGEIQKRIDDVQDGIDAFNAAAINEAAALDDIRI